MLLLEHISRLQFKIQFGDAQSSDFSQTRADVHAFGVWIYQPDMLHTPGPVFFKLFTYSRETVVGRENFDCHQRRGYWKQGRLIWIEDCDVGNQVDARTNSHPRFEHGQRERDFAEARKNAPTSNCVLPCKKSGKVRSTNLPSRYSLSRSGKEVRRYSSTDSAVLVPIA